MANNKMQAPKNGSVPNPDPTERTVEQLLREIATSREIVESKAAGYQGIVETRFNGMDKAIELLQKSAEKIPQYIKESINHLEELHNERFRSIASQIKIQFGGIDTQFAERDKRTEQLSLADKTAIAAALQAQKEAAGATTEMVIAAITKMDANFTKLIDQTQNLLVVGGRNTDEKINDLKGRFDRGEGRLGGNEKAADRTSANIGLAISATVASVVVMGALIGLVAFLVTRAPAPVYLSPPPPSAVVR